MNMGKEKYLKEVLEFFNKSPVVNLSSIKMIIKNKKKVKQYQKQFVKNLVSKNRIKRITKGYYTIYEDPSLAVFCFKPAYLGLQDALSFHNLWEQETIPVIITGRKIRQGIRKVFGMNVLIRRINIKYLFGFNYEKEGDFYFPYSDVEKTFIDLVYFRNHMDKEVIEEFARKIDKRKLNSYLKVYPKVFRKKVFNFLS